MESKGRKRRKGTKRRNVGKEEGDEGVEDTKWCICSCGAKGEEEKERKRRKSWKRKKRKEGAEEERTNNKEDEDTNEFNCSRGG